MKSYSDERSFGPRFLPQLERKISITGFRKLGQGKNCQNVKNKCNWYKRGCFSGCYLAGDLRLAPTGITRRPALRGSRTPQNPPQVLNTLILVSVRESRIQYLCDPQWFRDTASRGPTTIVAPESQFRTCPSDHVVPENSNAIVGVVTTGFECLPPSCDGLTGPDDHGPMISIG
ncbi:inactive receptor-like serine/threonine-protein kinase [Dorcoceras hygrometricum]|uniref:Inactive receptor-like serine/threonine-protein kinase n=1 Tax=Dorcoceras hygrometricum TaxID=472368 RepID=A0A2Z7AK58_9LAMI|nr:inactive receptor-like serine/threonine-protein kinase [Dorcoceras hygrometricum]